ncbi:MAG: GntR family transcriptional regulator [Rhizobiaceae bacterium]
MRKARLPRPSLEAETANLIRADILNGVWKQGERLVEMDLATSFGVSQSTIRGALKYLQADALVVHRPRRGHFVIEISEGDVREISILRDTLESLGARLAAQTITDEGRIRLERVFNDMCAAARMANRQKLIELDLSFHRTVVEIAGSERLNELYKRLVGPALLFLRMADHLYPEPQVIVDLHEPLLSAICSGDADRAFALAHRHTEPDAQRMVHRQA